MRLFRALGITYLMSIIPNVLDAYDGFTLVRTYFIDGFVKTKVLTT
jgi:hypothetical protein